MISPRVVVDGEVIDIDVEEVEGVQLGEDEITIHVKGHRVNVGLPTVVRQGRGYHNAIAGRTIGS